MEHVHPSTALREDDSAADTLHLTSDQDLPQLEKSSSPVASNDEAVTSEALTEVAVSLSLNPSDQPPVIDEFPVLKLSSLAFVYTLFGLGLTMPGPAMADIKRVYGVNNDTAGLVFVFVFLGLTIGTILLMFPERVFDKIFKPSPHHAKRLLLTGLALSGGGCVLLALYPPEWGIMGFFLIWLVLGMAFSFFDLSCNMVPTDMCLRNQHGAFSMMHMGFGAGAMAGPFLYTGIAGGSVPYVPYVWALVALSVTIFTCVKLISYPSPAVLEYRATKRSQQESGHPHHVHHEQHSMFAYLWVLLRSKGYWLILTVILLYNASEMMVGGWLFSLLEEQGEPDHVCALATTLYWCGLSMGRLGLGVLMERLPRLQRPLTAIEVVAGSGIFAGIASLLLVIAPSVPIVFLWAYMAGLGMSGVFPLIVSFASAGYQDPVDGSTSLTVGGVLVFANLGGLVFPPAVGVVAEALSVRYALLLTAACLACLVLLSGITRWHAVKTRLFEGKATHHH
jgi:fucose permease